MLAVSSAGGRFGFVFIFLSGKVEDEKLPFPSKLEKPRASVSKQ